MYRFDAASGGAEALSARTGVTKLHCPPCRLLEAISFCVAIALTGWFAPSVRPHFRIRMMQATSRVGRHLGISDELSE